MTWASGKVILIGEHAVVFGHPALAGALARGVDVRVDREHPGRLTIPGWGIDVPLDRSHPVAAALCDLIDAAGVAMAGLGLTVTGDLAAGVGLGSSAALAVATARAVCAAFDRAADDATIERLATTAEARFHGRPSGIDVAVSARGGLGLFDKQTGWQPIDASPLGLVVGLSGEPKSTAAMLAHVASARARDPAGVDERMAAMGEAARAGAALLAAGSVGGGLTVDSVAALAPLLRDAHGHLAAIGLSTPGLDAMVAAAGRAGALAAKLTGAGGGGAVIALAPGREDAVLDAWRAGGRDGFATAVGVRL